MAVVGILRSIAKAVGGVVFGISLAGLIFSVGLVEFTKYDSLKSVFSEILVTQIGSAFGGVGTTQTTQGLQVTQGTEGIPEGVSEEQLEEGYQRILEMCEGKESVQVQIPAEAGAIAGIMTINCSEVRAAAQEMEEGTKSVSEIIGDVTAGAIFDNIYYKKYDCSFVDCVQTGQLGIVFSAQGNEFFKLSQLYLAVGVAAGAVIVLISAENWPSRLKGLGWPMVSIGISYFLIGVVENLLVSKLPGVEKAGIDISSLVDKMVAPMMDWFLITLAIGAALTAGGYVLAYKEKKKSKK